MIQDSRAVIHRNLDGIPVIPDVQYQAKPNAPRQSPVALTWYLEALQWRTHVRSLGLPDIAVIWRPSLACLANLTVAKFVLIIGCSR